MTARFVDGVELREVRFKLRDRDTGESFQVPGWAFQSPWWSWLRLVAARLDGKWRVYHYDSGAPIKSNLATPILPVAIRRTLIFLAEMPEWRVKDVCRRSGLHETEGAK